MKINKFSVSWIIALTLMALGTALLWHAFSTARTTEKRLLRKQDTLKTLWMLRAQALQDEAAMQRYNASPDKSRQPIENLRPLLEQSGASQWTPLGTEPVTDGWNRETIRISVTNLNFAVLTDFFNQAATMQPPWILQAIDLNPGPSSGAGKAILILASIHAPQAP
ncbi:MAG: hypothetical protein PHP44_03955 [Kiritimatiellae bacterium]|nr:hypothetical protein [Kiritimatiellia bacterium]MDD4735242.1 hypothetical protein [Kiritimatiellia bacterium]